MPLDSAAPQSTVVFGRQIGGRSIGYQSPWWKTLFTSEDLRIDGRVPTKNSSEFLTQVRLNPTKELIAVAFSPVAENLKADFSALIEYLNSREYVNSYFRVCNPLTLFVIVVMDLYSPGVNDPRSGLLGANSTSYLCLQPNRCQSILNSWTNSRSQRHEM